MLNDTNHILVIEKLNTMQASVNIVSEMLVKMQKQRVSFGEWISEKEEILASGNIRLTEEQFTQWSTDNSFIDNIVLTQLGLEISE